MNTLIIVKIACVVSTLLITGIQSKGECAESNQFGNIE